MRFRAVKSSRCSRIHHKRRSDSKLDGNGVPGGRRRRLRLYTRQRHLGMGDDGICVSSLVSQSLFILTLWQELVTGKIPFYDLAYNRYLLALHISTGGLPRQPASPATEKSLTPGMWDLLHKCWSPLPESRPSAADMVSETWQLQCVTSVRAYHAGANDFPQCTVEIRRAHSSVLSASIHCVLVLAVRRIL